MTVKDRRFDEPPKYTFKDCVGPVGRHTGQPMALTQNGMTKLSKNRDTHIKIEQPGFGVQNKEKQRKRHPLLFRTKLTLIQRELTIATALDCQFGSDS